jgi:hypothetical protein
MAKKNYLTKADIIKNNQPKVREIELWEGFVFLKSLTARQVITLQDYIIEGKATEGYYARLISESVVDGSNEYLFTVEEADVLEPEILNYLLLEIMEFNKMNPDGVAKAKAELKKMKEGSSTSS